MLMKLAVVPRDPPACSYQSAVPIRVSRASVVPLISRNALDIMDSETNGTTYRLVTWSIFAQAPKV